MQWLSSLRDGLAKSRNQLAGHLNALLGRQLVDDEFWERLDETLIGADFGVATTEKIVEQLKLAAQQQNLRTADEVLRVFRADVADYMQHPRMQPVPIGSKPHVVLVIGVNGSGKTTTIGKLAAQERKRGHCRTAGDLVATSRRRNRAAQRGRRSGGSRVRWLGGRESARNRRGLHRHGRTLADQTQSHGRIEKNPADNRARSRRSAPRNAAGLGCEYGPERVIASAAVSRGDGCHGHCAHQTRRHRQGRDNRRHHGSSRSAGEVCGLRRKGGSVATVRSARLRRGAVLACHSQPGHARPTEEITLADKDKEKDKDKDKALENTLAQIERQFGKGSIMKLGEAAASMQIETISTGSLALDIALGVGGLPRGRVVEIYGPESSGKTTLTLHVIAEAQKAGGVAAFIDVEHALDPAYAQALGVDLDNLLVSQPDTGEQALDIAEMLVRSNSVDVVVIDSVAALVPRAEIEGDMGDAHVGLQARLMSQALRKLTAAISKSRTTMIFINQIREKVGVMFGNPETTSGGRALKFYASVRMDIRKLEQIKSGTDPVGSRTRVKVVKNKVAPPFQVAEFDIMYGKGISRTGDLIDLGLKHEIVGKSGSWYTYGDARIGQGRENAKAYLEEHPEVAAEIDGKIRALLVRQGGSATDNGAPRYAIVSE